MMIAETQTLTDLKNAINAAFEFGDSKSALRQFADTRIIFNETHRQQILDEIPEAIKRTKTLHDLMDCECLLRIALDAPTGNELLTREEWLGS